MQTVPKIIVVDDENQICSNVEKILSKNNFEITRALSAAEAIEKMAQESYSLLISDIVMPGKNGLELLKLVKEQWPLTKAIMMTAYASTDTAMKAIRLGALDYISKPFTPEELRSTVQKALDGELKESPAAADELETIDVIDIDIPFDAGEVAEQIGDEYTNMMGRSDMPIVEVKMPNQLENYCEMGDMVCDIFKKLGATCKGGTKTGECPQKKAKKRKGKKAKGFNGKKLIGIDMPFDYKEVAAVTGPEYIYHLESEGVAFVPYEELKKNIEKRMRRMDQPENVVRVFPSEPNLRNILVIDDEVAVNNNIRKILNKKGFHVDQAITKDEAIDRISSQNYKLVLLDLRIPGVQGLDLLKHIRDHQPNARVIIITGYASIETAVESARLGVVDYLAKPFTPNEVRDAAEKAFRMAA